MLPYTVLAGTVIFLGFLSSLVFKWKAPRGIHLFVDPFLFGALAALILFSGTRVGLGVDYGLYERLFGAVNPDDWVGSISNSPQEIGFVILMLAIKTVSDNPYFFFFSLATLTVLLCLLAIRVSGANPGIAVTIYVLFSQFLSPMNIVRQGLSGALLFLAVVLFDKAGKFRVISILLFALAGSIHVSAFFAVALYLMLRYLKVNTVAVVAISAVALVGGASLSSFPPFRALLGAFNDRYVYYLDYAEGAGLGTILVASIHLGIGLLLLKFSDIANLNQWWLRLYLLTAPFYFLGTGIGWAARMGEFFSIFLVLLLPGLVSQGQTRRIGLLVTFVIGSGYFSAYLLNYGGLLPYESWLF